MESSAPSARRGLAFLSGLLLLGLAVASQFVTATYGWAPEPPPVKTSEIPAQVRARLHLVDGVPVLRLSGTPYEIGRQHGEILKRQIHFLFREYAEVQVIRTVGRKNLEEWAKSVEPFIPQDYKDELRGLADGAGVSYERALMCNTMVDRFQSMMCSTVAASGAATRDQEVYFGRNLDFPGRNILHKMTVVLVLEPEGKTPVVSVTWPGIIGVLSGMNARGVAGATMMIHRGKALQPGMPYMLMYREALVSAKKTGDVFDYIAKAKRTCPNNFMVVDKTGAAEVVEFDQETVARRPADKAGICSTNFFKTDALKKVGYQVGVQRYNTLERFLAKESGRIDAKSIQQALKDVAVPGVTNVQSMIFMPARRAMHLSVGGVLPAAAQRFVHLPRALLFGKDEASK